MRNIEEVADRIYRLETPLPGIDDPFTVYLIRQPKGILIEPGPATAIPPILEEMKHLGMKELAYVIPTHIHLDHGGAIGKLAELFPRAKVVIHPQAVKHTVDPSRLIQSTRMAFGDDFEVRYGPLLPVPRSQIKVPEDEEIISIDGRKLQIIYAPGHAPHHIAIFDHKTRSLFCGEALGVPSYRGESFTLPVAAPPSFDMEVYLETIERLRGLQPRVLLYSHRGVGREPEELISSTAENVRIFGNMILKALKEGETPEAIERTIKQYVSTRYGVRAEEVYSMYSMTVDGYTLYFRSKGLV